MNLKELCQVPVTTINTESDAQKHATLKTRWFFKVLEKAGWDWAASDGTKISMIWNNHLSPHCMQEEVTGPQGIADLYGLLSYEY